MLLSNRNCLASPEGTPRDCPLKGEGVEGKLTRRDKLASGSKSDSREARDCCHRGHRDPSRILNHRRRSALLRTALVASIREVRVGIGQRVSVYEDLPGFLTSIRYSDHLEQSAVDCLAQTFRLPDSYHRKDPWNYQVDAKQTMPMRKSRQSEIQKRSTDRCVLERRWRTGD